MTEINPDYLDRLPLLRNRRPRSTPELGADGLTERILDKLAGNEVTGRIGDAILKVADMKRVRLERGEAVVQAAADQLLEKVKRYKFARILGYVPDYGSDNHLVMVRTYDYYGLDGCNVLLKRYDSKDTDKIAELYKELESKPSAADVIITLASDMPPLFMEEGKAVGFAPAGALRVIGMAEAAVVQATEGAHKVLELSTT